MTAVRRLLQRQTSNVIPGLDGLRAISILCVLYGHLLWAPSFHLDLLVKVLNPAGLGVRLFFVISGFLITTILLGEKRATGTIRLRQFYYRRALRIFPPYYAFLLCVFILAWLAVIDIERSDYLYTLTYTFNLKGRQPTWWVGHTWSLAVEEQFYLLWPVAVLTLRRGTLKRVAVAFALAAPVCRALLFLVPAPVADHWYLALPCVADPIALGAVLSMVFEDDRKRHALRQALRQTTFWVVPLFVLGVESLRGRPHLFPHPSILTAILEPMGNIGLTLIVARAALVRDDLMGRILNSTYLSAVGVTSYSLYLWQMLFLSPASSAWLTFPLSLLWTALTGIASFVLIERPFSQLRRRVSVQRDGALHKEAAAVA